MPLTQADVRFTEGDFVIVRFVTEVAGQAVASATVIDVHEFYVGLKWSYQGTTNYTALVPWSNIVSIDQGVSA